MDLYYRQARRNKIVPFNDREAYMLAALTQLTGKEQKDLRPQAESYIKTINTGPLRAEEAFEAGLIDGLMYHHDLLDTLAQNGVKTWSVRKYLDAHIARAIFGDFDMDTWIVPQFFRWGKKDGDDEEAGSGKKDVVVRGAPKKIALDVTLSMPRKEKQPAGPPATPSDKGPLDGAVLNIEVVVPRTVGLVYLDNAIEGSHPTSLTTHLTIRKGRFGGEAMSAYLMKAAKDPSIHAIVFRINSPGGKTPK